MRIIAGKARGRKLKSIQGTGTRPTLDRVKESLFNILAPVIPGCKVLDLFAGFGGLGLEALSRGAVEATFVEKNYKNVRIIKENIQLTNFKNESFTITEDVMPFLKSTSKKFDIIFMDPPYGMGLVNKAISLVCKNDLLEYKGLVIAEHHLKDEIKIPAKLNLFREKKYGNTVIKMFQGEE